MPYLPNRIDLGLLLRSPTYPVFLRVVPHFIQYRPNNMSIFRSYLSVIRIAAGNLSDMDLFGFDFLNNIGTTLLSTRLVYHLKATRPQTLHLCGSASSDRETTFRLCDDNRTETLALFLWAPTFELSGSSEKKNYSALFLFYSPCIFLVGYMKALSRLHKRRSWLLYFFLLVLIGTSIWMAFCSLGRNYGRGMASDRYWLHLDGTGTGRYRYIAFRNAVASWVGFIGYLVLQFTYMSRYLI